MDKFLVISAGRLLEGGFHLVVISDPFLVQGPEAGMELETRGSRACGHGMMYCMSLYC